MATIQQHQILKSGYLLKDRYEIERVAGAGGFGVGYIATDIELETKVFIKECFPKSMVCRGGDQVTVFLLDAESENDFNWALNQFVQEGKTLASFREISNIVTVHDAFRANSTAYMVMSYEGGKDLNKWRESLEKEGIPLTEEGLLRVFAPLTKALDTLHQRDMLHRDIAADNIIIRDEKDGVTPGPVLIDFGSARKAFADRAMTAVIKPKYAPLEFYSRDGKDQGPWSDIYALGAVLHKLITGTLPPEATERVNNDPYKKLSRDASYSQFTPEFLKAIDWALEPRVEKRPKDLKTWFRQLSAGQRRIKEAIKKKEDRKRKLRTRIVAGVSALVAAAAIAYALLKDPNLEDGR
ncbi:MAG: protein kinase, partial [Verrucomicrobiota bacterium]